MTDHFMQVEVTHRVVFWRDLDGGSEYSYLLLDPVNSKCSPFGGMGKNYRVYHAYDLIHDPEKETIMELHIPNGCFSVAWRTFPDPPLVKSGDSVEIDFFKKNQKVMILKGIRIII